MTVETDAATDWWWPAGTKVTFPTWRWRLRSGSETNPRAKCRYLHAVSFLVGEDVPVPMCRVGDSLADRPPADPTGLKPCPLCVERLRAAGLWPL